MSNYISKDNQLEKLKKSLLTKEEIFNQLVLSHKVDFVGWMVVSVMALILAAVLVFALTFDSPFDEKWTKIAKAILLTVPFVMAAVNTIVYFYRRKRINVDDYKLVTDRVERVSEYDKKLGTGYRYEHAIYLWICGRVVMSHSTVKRISEGDVYYVLVSKKQPDKAVMLFDSKKCELGEMNEEATDQ